jgi:hypothetical protein
MMMLYYRLGGVHTVDVFINCYEGSIVVSGTADSLELLKFRKLAYDYCDEEVR